MRPIADALAGCAVEDLGPPGDGSSMLNFGLGHIAGAGAGTETGDAETGGAGDETGDEAVGDDATGNAKYSLSSCHRPRSCGRPQVCLAPTHQTNCHSWAFQGSTCRRCQARRSDGLRYLRGPGRCGPPRHAHPEGASCAFRTRRTRHCLRRSHPCPGHGGRRTYPHGCQSPLMCGYQRSWSDSPPAQSFRKTSPTTPDNTRQIRARSGNWSDWTAAGLTRCGEERLHNPARCWRWEHCKSPARGR
mmetsp:Transcript_24227/g.45071  ORF Transcript_24227/g.45071 Transcript_24227/m.45071 type:complete len:246 (-) Transcript_24227:458-1195(-)